MSILLNKTQINYITGLLKGKIDIKDIKNHEIRKMLENNVSNNVPSSNIENITSVLKYDFSAKEVKSNGITFTPIPIVKYMYESVLSLNLDCITKYKIADLSVGNGTFFIGLIILLKEKYPDISVQDLIENNLFGYDIKDENISLVKLNLYLITLYYGENPEFIKFNMYAIDTLKYFKEESPNLSFDIIVGNPPYVKQQNIPQDYRKFLLKSFNTISSNYNLYYAFLELSLDLLSDRGVSLQLVPNYLLKIKSAKNLREYLLKENHIRKIINFNSNKIFNGIDTYSMIIELGNSCEKIIYKSMMSNEDSLSELENKEWEVLKPSNISTDSINLIFDKEEDLVIKAQSQPHTLNISTGIATQKDKLFIVDNSNLDDDKFMIKYLNDKEYLINRESVVRVYKGSGQSKLNLNYNYIIYPYILNNNTAELKSIDYLAFKEPETLKYFNEAKKELSERSGITENDPNWYRYGRTQSLTRFEKKILFPTNSLKPNFNLIDDYALFLNGYAIYGLKEIEVSTEEFKAIEIILNSKLTEKFMLLTSYFIGSGYVSYQKKYIEKLTIPDLNDNQVHKIIELSELNNPFDLNKYIFDLYDLNYLDFI